jgi:hypothetical protein
MSNSSTRRRSSKASSNPPAGVDFAWRVHGLTQDWIRNVDQKAAIILAIVVAMSGFAATQVFTETGSLYAVTDEIRQWAIRVMGGALLVAGGAALYAVFPNLKRRRAAEFADSGLIYFGHLRHRSRSEIKAALERMDDNEQLGQLSLQLEQTSRIAWDKHARLQIAQVSLTVSVVAFLVGELA